MLRAVRRLCLAALFFGLMLPMLTVQIVHAATVTVTTTDDFIHSPGCATDGFTQPCSLRDTILYANANTGTIISIPVGVYTLTIPPNSANNATTGDLNLTASMTINGAGADATIIQASTGNSNAGIDRIFAVDNLNAAITVTINGVMADMVGGTISKRVVVAFLLAFGAPLP